MTKKKILVVDDEEFNLEILVEHLGSVGYDTETAINGVEAWELLQKNADSYHAVLLDRMMPEMDGLEVLRRIKQDPSMAKLPIILQTAMAATDQVVEGIEAGAYYYLTKPFDQKTLMAVVKTAVKDYERHKAFIEKSTHNNAAMALMKEGEFTFKTLDDCSDLAKLLSSLMPDDEKAVIGISELLINAVEHGNLGIAYENKTQLLETGKWEQEVKRRLDMPEYKDMEASIRYRKSEQGVEFHIKDCGKGFNWMNYIDYNPVRALDSHGRGILMAKESTFGELHYMGKGNEVIARISL